MRAVEEVHDANESGDQIRSRLPSSPIRKGRIVKCCSASSEPLSPARRALRVVLILAILAIILTVFLRAQPPVREIGGHTMGTTYVVKYAADSDGSRPGHDVLVSLIQATLDEINRLMSTYQSDSELMRFNAHTAAAGFQVSDNTAEVFRAALQISEETNGAFDITVGPIVNAYGFGPDAKPESQPSDELLAMLSKRIGYKMVHLDGNTLTKDRADIYCDLSAIAKGYGVDVIARALREKGIDNYMIEIGGEVRTRGTKPDGEPWRIGIQRPDDSARMVLSVIELRGKSMATSGDYRNFYVVDGKRVSHTIDPRTGRPITHNLASVTVVDDKCMFADAWATALMVLGPDEGYDLAVKKDLAASFIIRSGAGFTMKSTPAFDKIAEP
jgi:thiamine biosynthesis lipoprotein